MAKKDDPCSPLFYDVEPSGRGRPRKILNKTGAKMVVELSKIGMSVDDICAYIGVDKNTMYNTKNRDTFSSAIQEGKSLMNKSLRAAMYHKAVTDGNPTMQIFLAKNLLGMSDSPVQTSAEVSPLDSFAKTFAKQERRLMKEERNGYPTADDS